MKKSKLFLVDVSSMFFRAFYAVRPLSAPSGVPVNAVYGVLSMILKLIKDYKPEYLVFCYDNKEPSFRKEIYQEYKAHRTEIPEDLIPQIPLIKKMADYLGIPSVERPGYEADDIIGSLVTLGLKNKFEVAIVSSDKDFGQLITDDVTMIDTMKNTVLDHDGVKLKWGVAPEQFIDYLALMGDSSDNIPGVPGVGPKSAQKLIEQFNDLESIYKNIDQVKGESLKIKLIENKEMAFLSRRLVTIHTNLPLEPDFEHYKRQPFKSQELKDLLMELNFKSLEKTIWDSNIGAIKEVPQVTVEQESRPLTRAEAVETLNAQKLDEYLLAESPLWAFQNPMGLFFVLKEKLYKYEDDLDRIKQINTAKSPLWCGFDLKTLWHALGVSRPQAGFDVRIANYVLHAGGADTFETIVSTQLSQSVPELISPSEQWSLLQQLESTLKEKLKKNEVEEVFLSLDLPIAPILYDIEVRGVKLNTEELRSQSQYVGKEISVIEKKIQQLAGEDFNVSSPKQLAHVLFDKMKLPPSKKTKTGYSTDSEVLQKLKKNHPIINEIVLYRELTKLKSTYLDTLAQMVDSQSRLHSTFNQTLTSTGRLSSVDPNLQNIPIRTEQGAKIRQAFVAAEGKQLMGADYSQIELRVLAHFTKDAGLCRAFADDLDVHAATASEVFNVKLSEVSSEQRRAAKAINFGIAYGQGAFGLAENLGISRTEAQEIISKYFEKFSGVKLYIDETIKNVHETGFVTTLFGRKRFIEEVRSQNVNIRKFGERAAINAPIQGTAADIVKKAMIDVYQKCDLPMILQIHDELIFEGSPEQVKSHREQVVHLMESCASLAVPLKVNYGVGSRWSDL